MHAGNIKLKWMAAGAAMAAGLTLGASALAQSINFGDGAGAPLPLGRGEATPINTLTYQGRLTNPLGQPVSTTVSVTFRLMNDAGGAVYTTTAKSITPDAAGLFTTAIGDANDAQIPRLTLDSASAVQVIINGNPLTPTQPLNTLLGSSTFGTGVVGRSQTVGVAGSASGPSGWGVAGLADAANAIAVRGKSDSGVGVLGISATGFAIESQGHIKQSLAHGGALKAAMDTATSKCFNGQAVGATVNTGTCGFTLTTPVTGVTKINFGFAVNDRFVQVTPALAETTPGIAQIAGFDGPNTVIVKTWTLSGAGPAANGVPFVITVH